MVKVLMIMHHNALCTPYITCYVGVSYLHICDRLRARARQTPVHLTTLLELYLYLYLIYDSRMCIRL
jgi:hypothetical protein